MNSYKIVALVPMRHHSQRVPGKNYRMFAGRPLYHHIIDNLLACPKIDEVVINTDSPIIFKDAAEHFPQVRLIERPEHLRADTIPTNEVLLYDVSQVKADFYLQTHSTNPLLQMKRKTYKFRIYPNRNQETALIFTLNTCRHLYNAALAKRKHEVEINRLYQEFDVFPWGKLQWMNYYDQADDLTKNKNEYQKQVYSQILHQRT